MTIRIANTNELIFGESSILKVQNLDAKDSWPLSQINQRLV